MSAQHDNEKLLQDMIDAVRADVPSDSQWRVARRRLVERIRLHESAAESRETAEDSAGRDSELPSRWRWPRRVVWGGVGLAAAASILVALMLPRFWEDQPVGASLPGESFGQVAVARGHCAKSGADHVSRVLGAGEVVAFGDQLEVGPRSGLCLRLEDSTTLWLGPGTELICLGPRTADAGTVRLVRGEIRADVARSEDSTFSVETPAATLRVLGTEFHCRVLPALVREEDRTMTRLRSALQRAITVVTVLSGSVAVEAGAGEQVLKEGQRIAVIAGATPSAAEDLESLDYARRWLGEPGRPDTDEVLMFVPIHRHLLHALWAVDLETGDARHVSDFVGVSPRVVQQMGPDLALINAGSVLFAHFGTQPVGSAGRPFVKQQMMLLNLESGEKLPMLPLEDCNPLFVEVSPDRRRLAFTGRREAEPRGEREYGLFVLDLETFELVRLLEGALMTRPHWSPDSRWLAISKGAGYTNDHAVVLVDTLTGEVVEAGFRGAGVEFLPDGEHIVFSGGFARRGSWWEGVPSTGNLFIAELPDGPAEKITSLTNGGAVLAAVSPDGSHLAYWEVADEKRLHVLDCETLEDRVVWETGAPCSVRWLDGGVRLAVIPRMQGRARGWREVLRGFLGEAGGTAVTLVNLADDVVAVRDVQVREPTLSPGEKRAMLTSADELLSVFRSYRDGVEALDLHRIEAGQKHLKDASARLSAFIGTLSAEEADGGSPPGDAGAGTLLVQADLWAYQQVLGKEAEVSAADRCAEIVRSNLRCVSSLLDMYQHDHGKFPASLDQLVQWAAAGSWQIDHIRSGGAQARRLFVIPGDDPNTVTTSYRLIESEPEKGHWVVKTPTLPDGRQYVATYRRSGVDNQIKVDLKQAE
ncbi:MAG: FecR domain-containing protein [Phycisphaerales bacterium]|nr:MAG: FecR domain-containing protein [Phycisphaerales bacterium]